MTQTFSAQVLPQELTVFRDNNCTFDTEVKNGSTGELKDLTAYEGWFAVKDRDTHSDSKILIIKRTTVAEEGEKLPATGMMRFYLTRANTVALKAGIYFWDFGIYNDDEKITCAKGQLELKQPILLGDVPA